jgi:hypothetical protein
MQALLLCEDYRRAKYLSLSMKIFLNSEIIWRDHVNGCEDFLKNKEEYRLLVIHVNYLKDVKKNYEDLYKTIIHFCHSSPNEEQNKNLDKIKIIIFSDDEDTYEVIENDEHIQIKVVPIDYMPSILSLTGSFMGLNLNESSRDYQQYETEIKNGQIRDFISVEISLIDMLKYSLVDLYLRVKKNEKENHFIKRFLKGDEVNKAALNKYVGHGESSIYILEKDKDLFLQDTGKYLLAQFDNDEKENKNVWKKAEHVQEYLVICMETIYQDKHVQGILEKCLLTLKKTFKKIPALEHLILLLYKESGSFNFIHTQMISYVSTHLVKNLHWYIPGMEDKLIYAALLHDLLLSQDHWHRVRCDEDLKRFSIPVEERDLIRKHAHLMAENVRKISPQFADAANIIQQHHGQLSGLVTKKQEEFVHLDGLHPLSQVFMMAEELTHYLMESSEMGQLLGDTGVNKNRFIKDLSLRYKGKQLIIYEQQLNKIPFWHALN